MTSCRTYSPYGAWELKRAYQRNLLLANVSVILLVSLAIAIPSVLFGGKVVVAPPPVPPIPLSGDGVVELPTNTIHVVSEGRWPTPRELAGAIPIPIADSLIPDDNVRLASQDELAALYDAEAEDLFGRGIESTDPDLVVGTETAPERGEFVFVDQQPTMVHEVQPDYPRLARRAGLEGSVWIEALVAVDGSVEEVAIAVSSGTEALDDAAVAAAWKNRYQPALRGNEPVAVWVTYKVEFRLNK